MNRRGAIALSLVLAGAALSGCLGSHDVNRPAAGPCGLPDRVPSRLVKSPSELPDTAGPELMVLPGTVRPVRDFRDIVAASLRDEPGRPIVLYVHGRGDEPSKSIREGILRSLADEYGVMPILFTWPSGEGLFPEREARDTGSALGDVLGQLRDLRSASTAGLTVSLLTHSMGSFVLEGFLGNYTGWLPGGLLDSVVISSSSSTVDRHAGTGRGRKTRQSAWRATRCTSISGRPSRSTAISSATAGRPASTIFSMKA